MVTPLVLEDVLQLKPREAVRYAVQLARTQDNIPYTSREAVSEVMRWDDNNRRQTNVLRVLKRLGYSPCIYNRDGHCANLDTRCGCRQEYLAHINGEIDIRREEGIQKPHRCNYDPFSRTKQVLVVHESELMRGMIVDALDIIGISENRIDTAESIKKAEDILKQGKVDNKQYGLIISGMRFKESNGYVFANLLWQKNYNSRIILVSASAEEKPENYVGETPIIPGYTIGVVVIPPRNLVSAELRASDISKRKETLFSALKREIGKIEFNEYYPLRDSA